jgi:hypothetical protein
MVRISVGSTTTVPIRHRRISLEHLRGVPWARIGEDVGQRNLPVTANTYTQVLSDETEIEYEHVLEGRFLFLVSQAITVVPSLLVNRRPTASKGGTG